MKKFLKYGAIGFVILIVIGVIGSMGKSGNSTPSSSNSTGTQATSAPTQAPEAQKVTATEIADDFDGNAVSAEAKWKGKFVEFSAVVGNITDSGLSFTDIGSKQYSFTQISCKIKDKQQLLSLKNGETTTVRGIIGGQTIGVIDMTDCEVVK